MSNQENDPYPSRTKPTMLQNYNNLKNDFDLYDSACHDQFLNNNEQSYNKYKAQFHNFQQYMNNITRYVENNIMRTYDFHNLSLPFQRNLLQHIQNRGWFTRYYSNVHHAARSYGHSNNSTRGATTNEAIKAQQAITVFNDLINNYNYGNQVN